MSKQNDTNTREALDGALGTLIVHGASLRRTTPEEERAFAEAQRERAARLEEAERVIRENPDSDHWRHVQLKRVEHNEDLCSVIFLQHTPSEDLPDGVTVHFA